MARNSHCCVMVHVDDVMFCGDGWYWENVFLKKLQEHYNISHSQLQGIGREITFLKRRIKRLEESLVLIPGTKFSKVIELFEENFGKTRPQTIACDASIQTEDVSEEVGQRDALAFQAVIGTPLYLARDRPDLLFCCQGTQQCNEPPNFDSARARLLAHLFAWTTGPQSKLHRFPCNHVK